jgi:DNA-binding CsgD family transcriptional regulator
VQLAARSYVVRGRFDGEAFSFWIESPPGSMWRHLSHPLREGLDPKREILALTSDPDPEVARVIEEVARATGWFLETKRTLREPGAERNPVWRLMPHCLALFGQGDSGKIEQELDFPPGEQVSAQLNMWVRTHAQLRVSAAMLLGPDHRVDETGARRVVGATQDVPPAMLGHFLRVEPPSGRSVIVHDLQMPSTHWQHEAASRYRTALQISLPGAVIGRTFEWFVFWHQGGTQHAAGAALEALAGWGEMRRVIAQDTRMNARELQFLRMLYEGLAHAEIAQRAGCGTANVRHFLYRAAAHLGAPNPQVAIRRAMLLGLF